MKTMVLLLSVAGFSHISLAESEPNLDSRIYYKALDAGVYQLNLSEQSCFITADLFGSSCIYQESATGIEVTIDNPYTEEGMELVADPDNPDNTLELAYKLTIDRIAFNTMEDGSTTIIENSTKVYPENDSLPPVLESFESEDFQVYQASELASLNLSGLIAIPMAFNDTSDDALVNLAMDGTGTIVEGLGELTERNLTWSVDDTKLTVNFAGLTANFQVLANEDSIATVVAMLDQGEEKRLTTGVATMVDTELYGKDLELEKVLGSWQWREGETLFSYAINPAGEFVLSGGPDTPADYGVWTIEGDRIFGDRYLSTETGAPLPTFEEQLACHNGTLEMCEAFQTRWYKVIGSDEDKIVVLRYLEVLAEGGYKGHWVHVLRRGEEAPRNAVSSNRTKILF